MKRKIKWLLNSRYLTLALLLGSTFSNEFANATGAPDLLYLGGGSDPILWLHPELATSPADLQERFDRINIPCPAKNGEWPPEDFIPQLPIRPDSDC